MHGIPPTLVAMVVVLGALGAAGPGGAAGALLPSSPAPGPSAAYCDGNPSVGQCVANVASQAPVVGPALGGVTSYAAQLAGNVCTATVAGQQMCDQVDDAFHAYVHDLLDLLGEPAFSLAHDIWHDTSETAECVSQGDFGCQYAIVPPPPFEVCVPELKTCLL